MKIMGRIILNVAIVGVILLAVAIGYYKATYKEPEIPVVWAPGWWGRGEPKPDDTEIYSMKIKVSNKTLKDLHHRLANTRFGEDLEDGNFQYGFQAGYLKHLVEYWKDKYNWRHHEDILNSFPNYKTQIQGIDVHFMHVKPKGGAKGRPLLISHGWPGSVWEFYKIIPMLTDPEANGGLSTDMFEVIAPSIPGFGFSESPHQKGFDQADTARIYVTLMERLGFDSFYMQGGDWGATVCTVIAANYPDKVHGIHINFFPGSFYDKMTNLHNLAGLMLPSLFFNKQDREIISRVSYMDLLQETGYAHIQATKPDTVGSALNDSPAGLAAYILEKFSTGTDPSWRNLPDGGLTRKFTLDELLTNIMIYWISGNIAASQRYYKECFLSKELQLIDRLPVNVPAGLANFPNDLACPEAIASYKYRNIIQFTVMPRGGHFAALEEPRLLVEDIRSFVRKVEQ